MEIAITPQVVKEHGLTPEEYQRILKILGREPNINELGMYSVLWSEHCSYKNSKPQLKKFPTKAPWVLQGPGENAGIIDIGDGLACTFKIESHNHPSAVEPYQGAATGVGGIIRDVFTMGARPIALLNSLRFGELSQGNTPWLLDGVVRGIAGYGNCVGVPTVGGEIYFNKCYQGNPLVNAMCVGIVQSGTQFVHELYGPIMKGVAKGIGNPVVYVGAATGRDGIHGASFASVVLSEESESKKSSVQVGDPFHEKLLLEACLELIRSGAVVAMQDMGAAGLTSSGSEMASRGKVGIELDVALIPAREPHMTPYEFLLSESQERMLVILEKGHEALALAIFQKWGLNAVVIGRVTDDLMFRVLEQGRLVAEVPAASLADDAPIYQRAEQRPAYLDDVQALSENDIPDLTYAQVPAVLQTLLAHPSIASKRYVFEQYDYMVQTNTVQCPAAADAAVLRIKGSDKMLAVSTDCNSRMLYLDPQQGARLVLAEAARNVACTGARPMAVTDCLNWGNPENPEVFWTFARAVEGLAEACRVLETPVISGNVSLYNESPAGAIFPTPVIGMVGVIAAGVRALGSKFQKAGNVIVLVDACTLRPESGLDGLGGSFYLSEWHKIERGLPPQVDLQGEKRLLRFLEVVARDALAQSCHDISDGGLLTALVEMCVDTTFGFDVRTLPKMSRCDRVWFGEHAGWVLLEVPPILLERVKQRAQALKIVELGRVTGSKTETHLLDQALDLAHFEQGYKHALTDALNEPAL